MKIESYITFAEIAIILLYQSHMHVVISKQGQFQQIYMHHRDNNELLCM